MSVDGRKVRKFKRLCRELSDLMVDLHNEDPNIELFIAGEGITTANLVDTKGLDDEYWREPQDECIVAEEVLEYTDCGGF